MTHAIRCLVVTCVIKIIMFMTHMYVCVCICNCLYFHLFVIVFVFPRILVILSEVDGSGQERDWASGQRTFTR